MISVEIIYLVWYGPVLLWYGPVELVEKVILN